jgi:hypothetical protein
MTVTNATKVMVGLQPPPLNVYFSENAKVEIKVFRNAEEMSVT